ncbi:ABC transporter ATP-binding protein [Fusobacterium canifelinum]|uniref:ABC transporter ATP-binding protein n=1 Tax=Fusobacterium canifelinum TaxID=285729 RepID=UPI0030CE38F9
MKNFIKSIIFLIVLILSFFYYEKNIFKRFDILVDYAYYRIPKNSIDLLFVGSSHSYCAFNSRLFDHYLKCNSLNLGTSSQPLSVTYSAILEILKRQNPKIIIIEVYPIVRKPSVVALRSHLDTMRFSVNKFTLIKNSLPIIEWGNHFTNTIYYHSRWKEFNNLRKEDKSYENWGGRIENKGFLGYAWDFMKTSLTYTIYENEYNNAFSSSFVISKKSLKLLENLFKICQKRGIKIILTSPPVIGDYDTLNILYNLPLKNLMLKYNVDSVDFNNRNKKYEKLCFLDNNHVSLAGADEVSFEMAQFLKENYPILLNTENYKKYNKLDKSPEYYFYSGSTKNDSNFKTFDLKFELEKGVFINSLKIYKKSDDNFDLFLHLDENKSTDKIYEIALDGREVSVNLDKIQLNFITIKNETDEFPKYYIRKINNQKYIFKKDIEIPKDSKYYF